MLEEVDSPMGCIMGIHLSGRIGPTLGRLAVHRMA